MGNHLPTSFMEVIDENFRESLRASDCGGHLDFARDDVGNGESRERRDHAPGDGLENAAQVRFTVNGFGHVVVSARRSGASGCFTAGRQYY